MQAEKGKGSFARHVMSDYYRKYGYIRKPGLAAHANGATRKFRSIRLAFLLFNTAASLALVIMAFLVFS